MFLVSMFSSLAITLGAYAVINKIVWLAWVAWSLLMIAVFLGIKADCKRMDKDREYEDKIKELEKSIEYRDNELNEFMNAYGSLSDKVDYIMKR